jgi:hypothetical protein
MPCSPLPLDFPSSATEYGASVFTQHGVAGHGITSHLYSALFISEPLGNLEFFVSEAGWATTDDLHGLY